MKMLSQLIDRIVDWWLLSSFDRIDRKRCKEIIKAATKEQARLTDLRIETERRQSEKTKDPRSL